MAWVHIGEAVKPIIERLRQRLEREDRHKAGEAR